MKDEKGGIIVKLEAMRNAYRILENLRGRYAYNLKDRTYMERKY
jgi:hypothetical protein